MIDEESFSSATYCRIYYINKKSQWLATGQLLFAVRNLNVWQDLFQHSNHAYSIKRKKLLLELGDTELLQNSTYWGESSQYLAEIYVTRYGKFVSISILNCPPISDRGENGQVRHTITF